MITIDDETRKSLRSDIGTHLANISLTYNQRISLTDYIYEIVSTSLTTRLILAKVLNEFQIEPEDITEKLGSEYTDMCMSIIGLADEVE